LPAPTQTPWWRWLRQQAHAESLVLRHWEAGGRTPRHRPTCWVAATVDYDPALPLTDRPKRRMLTRKTVASLDGLHPLVAAVIVADLEQQDSTHIDHDLEEEW